MGTKKEFVSIESQAIDTSEIDELFNGIQSFSKDIDKLFSKLVEELSIADKEIIDLEHYIEFFNLPADKGYKAYKLLQDVLKRRRVIKNKMNKYDFIWNKKISEFKNDSVQSGYDKINKDRKYSPRILKELFNV